MIPVGEGANRPFMTTKIHLFRVFFTFFEKNLLKYLVGWEKRHTFAPAFEKVRCSLTDFHRQKL